MNKQVQQTRWISVDDSLPPTDQEVIVLSDYINGKYVKDAHRISFGHRPNPDGWTGKSIITGEAKHYDAVTYDGWNIPEVTHWIPCPPVPGEDEARYVQYGQKNTFKISEQISLQEEMADFPHETILAASDLLRKGWVLKTPEGKEITFHSVCAGWAEFSPKYKLDVKPRITNKLFEECLANVDPAIRKEVSDNIDKML